MNSANRVATEAPALKKRAFDFCDFSVPGVNSVKKSVHVFPSKFWHGYLSNCLSSTLSTRLIGFKALLFVSESTPSREGIYQCDTRTVNKPLNCEYVKQN